MFDIRVFARFSVMVEVFFRCTENLSRCAILIACTSSLLIKISLLERFFTAFVYRQIKHSFLMRKMVTMKSALFKSIKAGRSCLSWLKFQPCTNCYKSLDALLWCSEL